MKYIRALCLCFAVSACAAPDPRIVTKEVKVAVPTPCKPDIGPRPALLTKDQIKDALAKAPTLDDKTKIITEQLLLYIGWTPRVEAGLSGCTGAAP